MLTRLKNSIWRCSVCGTPNRDHSYGCHWCGQLIRATLVAKAQGSET